MAKTDWTLTDTVEPEDINDIGQEINQLQAEIRDRLDTADTSPVTLQPGLQVIQAERDARFKLGQIEGKTEINGQGRTGLIGVESPYVINTSGNLLPPFYEWLSRSPFCVEKPYTVFCAAVTAQVIYVDIPVIPDILYTLSFESLQCKCIAVHDKSAVLSSEQVYLVILERDPSDNGPYSVQFTGPETGVVRIHLYAYDLQAEREGADRNTLSAYDIRATNPTLTIGPEPQPFAPQRKSMLAFDTELHANPTDGSEPDVMFEENGEYRKLAKWNKLAIDGSMSYTYLQGSAGFKCLFIVGGSASNRDLSVTPFLTKYDGSLITPGAPTISPDNFSTANWANSAESRLGISILNTDSGWGDDYTPTQDEIKAYFNGWKMFLLGQPTNTPYIGDGTKAWAKVTDTNIYTPDYTTILPISFAGVDNQGKVYTPYNLLYQLAKETVEPVLTEGSLLLSEGDNMVEVGTGIVLREPNAASVASNGVATFNGAMYPLKYRAALINALYKNSAHIYLDASGLRTPGTPLEISNGPVWASLNPENYDPFAAYSVTYIKLDKSPVQSITGTLAANEKAQIGDLTAGVTEALQRVSVVEQKKAEKDAPPKAPKWIFPTLLNGWVLSSNGVFPAQYSKDDNGIVYINGIVNGGATDTIIFTLPIGFRPKTTHRISAVMNSGTIYSVAIMDIKPNGNVSVAFSGTAAHVPLHCSFPAEQ